MITYYHKTQKKVTCLISNLLATCIIALPAMIVIIAKRERAPQKKETPTSIMLDVRIKMLSRNKKKKKGHCVPNVYVYVVYTQLMTFSSGVLTRCAGDTFVSIIH